MVTRDPFTREGIDQCEREIAAIEEQLLAGHLDVPGLCLALADWSAELRILLEERKKPPGLNPAACGNALGTAHDLME
jgi:hypothetical protein